MAGKKISALAAITGALVAPSDLLAVVDVSDTTMAASGTTKVITREELQVYAAGVLTSDKKLQDLSATWNNGAVAFTGIKLNVTNTASNVASKLVDLQVGGSSVFHVTPSGMAVAKALTYSSGTSFMAGSNASDNGSDWCGIWVDQICEAYDRYSVGIGVVNRFSPQAAVTAPQAIGVAIDGWGWVGLSSTAAHSAQTFDEGVGVSAQVSSWADNGKAVTVTESMGLKVQSPTKVLVGTGTVNVIEHYGVDVKDQSGYGTTWGAVRLANNNYIVGRNAANTANKVILGIDSSDNVIFGDSTVAMLFNGSVVLSVPPFGLLDGVAAPATIAGFAQLYVDSADGDLKVKFGNGVVKTIAVDT